MNLAAPWWLAALPVVAVLAAVVAFASWRHGERLRKAFGADLLARVLPGSVRWRRRVRDVGALLGLALVVVALAEPRFDKQIRTVRAKGVDIVLVLDLSRSMDCSDVEPSRLERARREIEDLFRVLQGDRVGLVVYAGGAWPRLPLTEDLSAVQLVTSELDTSVFQSQGSALGAAIREGTALLERSEGVAGRALLVLSDGEVHEGDDALVAADEATDAGVVIYALGIGEGPAPVPVGRGGWLDWNGERVTSTPSDAVLRELARKTGGAYVKSVASSKDVVQLYEGEMRTRLVAVERDAKQRETWRSAFQWPLGLGLLLLLGGAWLGEGRGRGLVRVAAGAAALALGLAVAPGTASATTLAEADALYRQQAWGPAAEAFTELSLEHPGDADVFDRLGAARYRAGDFEGAARAWDQASRLRPSDLDATYNAGNAHWRAGRLIEAKDRFDRVVAADPGNQRATANRDLLAQEIEARRNPPPPPPPKPGSDDQQGNGGQGDEQDPSDPQAGNDGEQNQGDPQDGSQPQDGDPQPQDGNPPPNGSPGDPSRDPQQGDPQPQAGNQDGGTEQEGSQDPSDPSADGAAQDSAGEAGQPITAGQAERLLDGVEEGTQRVQVSGPSGGKPW